MFKLEYDNDQGEENESWHFQGTNWNPSKFYNKFSVSKKMIPTKNTVPYSSNSSTFNNTSKYRNPTFEFQLDLNKDKTCTNNTGAGPFVCHYCDAKFRIRGYLTRHIKKHAIEKAYRCPFYKEDAPKELRCHHSGGFSRRDTYKTHLKTRHLLYPHGVKPSERNRSYGHCAQCGEYCESTKDWVEQHIESGKCKGLPQNYLRVVRHDRSRNGKLKMIRTSNGHSRFITTAQSVVDPNILSNKEALEAMAIVAHKVNKDNILSKYGNDKIIMDVKDFSSDSEDEQTTFPSVDPAIFSNNNNNNNMLPDPLPIARSTSVTGEDYTSDNKPNPVDKLLEPFDDLHKQVPLDMSTFEFDHFTNPITTIPTTATNENYMNNNSIGLISKLPVLSESCQSNTPSPMTLLQQDFLLNNITGRNDNNNTEDIYSLLPN